MKKAIARPLKAREKVKSPGRALCFVIMPFGPLFDIYYEKIYMPAIKEAGLEPKRADDLYRPSNIINDIWSFTKRSKILLADLSQKNPNVFYELGLAHALAKPAILTASSMDDVPYDLRSLRVLVYDRNIPDWGRILKDSIIKAIKEILASPNDSVPPTFIETSAKAEPPTMSALGKTILQMRQDIESLRREVATKATSYAGSHVFPLAQSLGRAVEFPGSPSLESYLIQGSPRYGASFADSPHVDISLTDLSKVVEAPESESKLLIKKGKN